MRDLAYTLHSQAVLPLSATQRPRSSWLPMVTAIALISLAAWQAAAAGGGRQAALVLIAVGLGFALSTSGFGFAGGWREALVERRGGGFRAQLLLLALLTVAFFPLLAGGSAFGQPLADVVRPVGISLLVGAFLFGMGAQFASACSSGSFCGLGNGKLRFLIVAVSMVAGAFLASAHYGWWEARPRWFSFSMLRTWGVAPAMAVNLFLIGAAAAVSMWLERARHGSLRRPPRSGYHWLRGPWPRSAGVIAISALCVATLLLAGRPWIIISALPLWGAKLSAATGASLDIEFWDYWSGDARVDALGASLWADATTVMIFGLILGTALAGALAGTFRLHFRIRPGEIVGALAGGLLLGYGGVVGLGCNIGAFVAGIASGSLHGWVWLAAALCGSAAAFGVRSLASGSARSQTLGSSRDPA